MRSKHRDPKTVIRYDHGRENLEQNAVNFLGNDRESRTRHLTAVSRSREPAGA